MSTKKEIFIERSVRLPEELAKKVQKEADIQCRSFNKQVQFFLEQSLEQENAGKSKAA